MNICCCWLDVLFQPRSSVCATRISLGLMINAGMLLAFRRLIFGRPMIALGLTGKSLSTVKCENETYSEAKRQYCARNRDVLMNAQSPHKWWSTLKFSVLVEVFDWCTSRLAKLNCSRIILMASSPGSLLTCRSLALRDLPPLPSGRVRSGVSC